MALTNEECVISGLRRGVRSSLFCAVNAT